jgi:hypothetical protein
LQTRCIRCYRIPLSFRQLLKSPPPLEGGGEGVGEGEGATVVIMSYSGSLQNSSTLILKMDAYLCSRATFSFWNGPGFMCLRTCQAKSPA